MTSALSSRSLVPLWPGRVLRFLLLLLLQSALSAPSRAAAAGPAPAPQPTPSTPSPPDSSARPFAPAPTSCGWTSPSLDHHGEPVTRPDEGRLRDPRRQRPADGPDVQVHAGQRPAVGTTTICRCRFGHPSTQRPRPRATTFACSSSSGTSTTSRRCARPSRAREVLTDFVRNAFGPTDLVALMDPLTPLDAIRFTRDRQALADKVHTLQGRLGVVFAPAQSDGRSAVADGARRRSRALAGDRIRARRDGPLPAIASGKDARPSCSSARTSVRSAVEGRRHERELHLAGQGHSAGQRQQYRDLHDSTRAGLGPPALGRASVDRSKTPGPSCFRATHRRRRCKHIVKEASAFYLLGYAPPE